MGGGAAGGLACADPVDRVVGLLGEVDRLMAKVLRGIADAGGVAEGGLPARRLIGLAAGVTGAEGAFLERCVQTLAGMPRTWAAFEDGRVSWSQVRAIVVEARRLSAAQRQVLDDRLADTVEQARTSEPDRVGEVAADLVWRLDRVAVDKAATTAPDASRAVCQPSFDGWGDWFIHADPGLNAVLGEVMNAAADPPSKAADPHDHDNHEGHGDHEGHDGATDDDGAPIPADLQDRRSRSTQLAEGLYRALTEWLATPTPSSPARPRLSAVVDVRDLFDDPDLADAAADSTDLAEGVTPVTPRLLWQMAGGSTRISAVTTRTWACDATLVPILTDGTVVMATGRGTTPVSRAMRDAVITRDQHCRFPGCHAPARWTDIHHVIPRPGPTDITNLLCLCRRHHRLVHANGWTQTLHPDGTYVLTRGRRRLISRPPLRPT